MADTNSPQRSTPTLHSLLAAFDHHPYALTPTKPQPTPDSGNFSFERGPRYNLYSHLRESRLRAKRLKQQEGYPYRSGRSSVSTQSVSLDFSPAVSRKENRSPSVENVVKQSGAEKCFTPPPGIPKASSRVYGSDTSKLGGGGGSQSASAVGEKRGLMGRKSYASIEDLKGLSIAAASAIAGESRGGGRIGRMLEELKAAAAAAVVNAGEKRSVGAMARARKSFANFDDIRGSSSMGGVAGFAWDNCQRSGGRGMRQGPAVLGSSPRHW